MRIINTIANIATVAVVCVAALLAAAYVYGIHPYVVMSGSMEPAIGTGSLCFINTRADYSAVEEGDVIAFDAGGGTLVTHRAVTVTDEGIETKGDANDASDGISTTEDNFVGQNLGSIPKLGYLFRFFVTTRGKIIGGGVFVCLLVLTLFPFCEKEKKQPC